MIRPQSDAGGVLHFQTGWHAAVIPEKGQASENSFVRNSQVATPNLMRLFSLDYGYGPSKRGQPYRTGLVQNFLQVLVDNLQRPMEQSEKQITVFLTFQSFLSSLPISLSCCPLLTPATLHRFEVDAWSLEIVPENRRLSPAEERKQLNITNRPRCRTKPWLNLPNPTTHGVQ